MLNLVEARNSQGALLKMPLEDTSGGLVVEEIEGLGPVEATISSSSFANLDGEYYQNARREPREITFRFSLDPNYAEDTVADLRRRLYNWFMPKSAVELIFHMSDLVPVNTEGRTKSMETVLFDKDPQISVVVRCFDPDFLDLTARVLEGTTTELADEIVHEYPGTIDTGVLYTLTVDRDVSEFTIYHRGPDGVTRSMDFASPLLAGDVLEISTVPGDKHVTRIRDGVRTSVLYGLSPQSDWTKLRPGTNYLRFYAVGAPMPFSMTYNARYGGL